MSVLLVCLGDSVDIIFDLTGDAKIRQGLRQRLKDEGNQHTVIAPEVIAKLMWCFFDEDNAVMAGISGGY